MALIHSQRGQHDVEDIGCPDRKKPAIPGRAMHRCSVYYGIKNPPKRVLGSRRGRRGHPPGQRIRSDDDQAGIEKHAALVAAVGISKQERRVSVHHQPHQGQDIRIDTREREQAHDGVEQNAASSPDSAGPSHMSRS